MDSFVGQDARYSENFEEIENSISSAAALFTNTVTDWPKVIELSVKLLTTQSKDIRVLCWFTWALFKKDSFEGLQVGLHITNTLIEKNWADIYPTKQRTRVSSFDWLVTRIEQLFQETVPVYEHIPLFTALLEELKRLDGILTSQWPDQDNLPLIMPTCRRLERMLTSGSETNKADSQLASSAAAEAAVKASSLVSSTPSSLTAVSSLDNERDANKLLRTLQDNSRALCTWWLNQRPTDIKALRLNRTLLWLIIETLPENKEGVTVLRPIPNDKINNYKERLAQGLYSDLIVDVEASISKAPFWLDGQYIVWQCVKALRIDAAMVEIEVQLALFLERLPQLIELQFHDKTPFADENTVSWINEYVLPRLKSQTAQLATQSIIQESGEQAPWDVALHESISVLSKVKLKESMSPLMEGLNKAKGEREKFFWRLCMAKLCLADKRYELAKTQLENLDDQICQLGIDKWEPALVLEVVYLLYKCCELLPQSQIIRESKEQLYKRLCFLNMDLIMDEN